MDLQQYQYNNSIIENYPCEVSNNTIPLGVIFYDYNKINPRAINDGLLVVDAINNKFVDISGPGRTPLESTTCFVASLMASEVSVGTYTVHFDPGLFKSNKTSFLNELYIDFEDGRGFVRIFQGGTATVSFHSSGIKNIKIKAVHNNVTYMSYAAIDILPSSLRYSGNTPAPDYGPVEYVNEGIIAEYGIWYGCEGVLRKPYLIVSGFDPGDNNRLENETDKVNLYNVANKNGYLDELRANGYDIVIYRSKESTKSIITNAMNLVRFIQKINMEKTSDNELIIAGASMGGLVVRYALTYMEYHGLDHQTKLFISIDSPQNGANVPLSFQLMILNLYYDLFPILLFSNTHPLATFMDMLYNEAAKEMLIYHASNLQGAKAYCASERTNFVNSLSNLGNFPKKCRSIAVSMGSGTAVTQGFSAGQSVLKKAPNFYHHDILNPGTNLHWEFELWALPNNTHQKIYTEALNLRVCAPILVPCSPFPWQWDWECILLGGWQTQTVCVETPINSITFFVDNTMPLDNAPGSKQGLHNLSPGGMNIVNKLMIDFALFLGGVNKDPNYDCFIPSYSALGLNIPPHTNIKTYLNGRSDVTKIDNNLYQNFNKTTLSPFDFLYIEDSNDFHIYHPDTKEGIFSVQMLEAMSNISYPQSIFLENRIIGAGKSVAYEAPDKIVAGYGVDETSTNHGDFIVASGGKLELNASQVILKHGFHAQSGSNVKISASVFWTCLPRISSPQDDAARYSVKMAEFTYEQTMIGHDQVDNIHTRAGSDYQPLEMDSEIEIFPNPVIDKLYIYAGEGSNILKMYDINGRLLHTSIFSDSIEIDMTGMAAGIYIFQLIQSNGNVTAKKIIKQ